MVISTADAILYAVLLLIMCVADAFIIWLASVLEYRNITDEEGHYIGITLQKYGRILLIGFLWGMILYTLNLMNAVAQNLADLTQFAGLIGFLFSFMLNFTVIWVFGVLIFIFIQIWRDASLFKLIQDQHDKIANAREYGYGE